MRYRDQFYNEGLATTLYLKPVKFVKKKVRNKSLQKFVCFMIKAIYTILAIIIAILVFIIVYPL